MRIALFQKEKKKERIEKARFNKQQQKKKKKKKRRKERKKE